MKKLLPLAALLFVFSAVAEQPSKRKPDPEAGKELYMRGCWQCHGREADGAGPAAPALNVEVPSLRNKVGKQTIEGFIKIVQDGRGAMPSYTETITYSNIRRVFIYIQSLDEPNEPVEPEPDDEDADEPLDEANVVD